MKDNKLLHALISVLTLVLFIACGQSGSKKEMTEIDQTTNSPPSFTIDTFSTFPPEIDGCSCYFSNDSIEFKKGQYIYMNNFREISFLKINNVLTKFTQDSIEQVNPTTTIAKAKSDLYKLSIESIDGIQNGDETWLKTGTIKLKDNSGNILTKTFYGECGC